ncbi:MAG TPA: hypothetical protein VLX64_03845 [Thermoplasmata archaeon]|nr:hypothetical protein [Thermoplasmata archaeon]HUJ78121.1 hypothetical protein [Thermoplasmata archaeon]
MARTERAGEAPGLSGIVEALTDKQGQIDLRLDHVGVSIPGWPIGIELNGIVTVSVHLRELAEEERRAHIARTVAAVRPA